MTRIKANNHAGYAVEWLSPDGWTICTREDGSEEIYGTHTEAFFNKEMNVQESEFYGNNVEYRVYEALHMKEQA